VNVSSKINARAFTRTVIAAGAAMSVVICASAAQDAGPATAASRDAHAFDYEHQRTWHVEAGDSQSPIEIRSSEVVAAERLRDENDAISVSISRAGATVIDNGHTVQVVPKNSSATIRGRHFGLVQVHFHAPAEHTIDGKRFPLEGHFVFKAQDGRFAVVAVLYQSGTENEQFAAIAKTAQRDMALPLASFDAAALMPADLDSYFHYLGSLTTPPLTENVEWYVLQAPVDLSPDDIADFTRHYSHNARDPQPLNGRPLLKYAR
jgi:carbonic anhydrase